MKPHDAENAPENHPPPPLKCFKPSGFTLIELSISLVIIGLIIGGILVGQDLIKAAAVRAQVSQIDKYNSAVNTFYGKYGFLPGDIPDPNASRFGFAARGTLPGCGDGNGLIEGNDGLGTNDGNYGIDIGMGEPSLFWEDLSVAGYVDGGFHTASATSLPASNVTLSTTPNISAYMPQAKIGNGNYVYVYSSGTYVTPHWITYGINWFGLSQVNTILAGTYGRLSSTPGLSVIQAYNIDKKVDDGLPESGSIIATYLDGDIYWMDGTDSLYNNPYTGPIQGTATTCYDNNSTNNTAPQYSTSQNGGTGINCALSFQMQGGGR